MSYIKSIILRDKLKNYKYNSDEKSVISNLSKLNIFIGSNNSGKSRFIRNILTDKELKYNFQTDELELYNDFIERLNKEIYAAFNGTPIKAIGNIQCREDSISKIEYLEERNNIKQIFINLIENLEKVNSSDNVTSSGYSAAYDCKRICEILNSISDKYIKEFEEKSLSSCIEKKEFKRIYIPTLRGLRRLEKNEDLLKIRTINDYFGSSTDIEIFTGQDLYNEVLKLLCGDFKSRNYLRDFEDFLSNCFFDRKRLSLIPKIDSDVLHIKIGEEREQPIYNLGDGIQSIIILTFKLFASKGQDVLFFIEEPELYLHPGLQRKVIETFLDNEFSTYQYFMTTHSNHLLDLTLDMSNISVYKFYKELDSNDELEKDAKFLVENLNDGDTSVLQLLGVNNSSIFLSNCTIWVEGITDRLYIRKFLSIYQKEKFEKEEIDKIYIEDIHYSFLEYSGGNITHWDFLDNTEGILAPMKHKKICNKIFLIADSDGYNTLKTGMKSQRLKLLEDYFKEKFYCLNAKEFENILSPEIIKKTVIKFKDHRFNDTEKDQDGILFSEVNFSIDDYRQLNIGKFIDDKIIERIMEKKLHDKSFQYEKVKTFKKGNTINRKVQFCKYAIEEIKTISDMSDDAIELCDKIYNFIKFNN